MYPDVVANATTVSLGGLQRMIDLFRQTLRDGLVTIETSTELHSDYLEFHGLPEYELCEHSRFILFILLNLDRTPRPCVVLELQSVGGANLFLISSVLTTVMSRFT